MNRALVVYESMFGNTEAVARAVADGLSTGLTVEVVPVSAAAAEVDAGVSLLVVGGPTHAFGLSRNQSRAEAVKQGARPAGGPERGLRDWLSQVRPAAGGPAAVAFDTRVKKRGVPGSAARAAQRLLRRRGFPIAAPARSFFVLGTPGPMLDGELARARQWGVWLATATHAAGDTLIVRS